MDFESLKINSLNGILANVSSKISVDLGTANSLVYKADEGIIVDEPSVVAVNQKKDEILTVGKEALKMIGKTPDHIKAERPLTDGVISNFEVAEMMLSYFLDKVQNNYFGLRPQVVASVPQGATEVDCNSVEDALKNAGAREVKLIKEPMAAAIGARLPIKEARGSMVVDIGGGTTEIAVISLGGIVVEKDIRIAGDYLADRIQEYVRSRFNLLIGKRTAEKIKHSCGAAIDPQDRFEDQLRGRDLVKGLPRSVEIDGNQVFRALNKPVASIVSAVKETIEEVPPELVDDLIQRGVLLTGGGALLRGLTERLKRELEIPVKKPDDPLTSVVRGAGVVLENPGEFEDVVENS